MPSRWVPTVVRVWNRKLHFYVGLFLLLFVWLYALSGLLLNHGTWKFAEFWPQRKITSHEQTIRPPSATNDVAIAQDLMQQLGLRGEIVRTETRPESSEFSFRVARPGEFSDVKADLIAGRAEIETTNTNAWGVFRGLHTFTGTPVLDPKQTREWFFTKLWSVSMDAVSIGMIFLVLSGVYMWYQLAPKRRLGLVMIGLGLIVSGLFVFGLHWKA